MHYNTLRKLILRHYSRSALVPILTIELALLVLYFAVSTYINHRTKHTMRAEVGAVMPHFAHQHAAKISTDFALISRQTAYFAQAHAELLANIDSAPVLAERPNFAIAPTGALYQTNLTSGSSLYYIHAERLTPAQLQKAEKTATLNPLYRHVVIDTPNVVAAYFNTPDNMNRLYPFIPKVFEQYPADLHMDDYNFYYLADAKHDPSRKLVWTGGYLDPAGQGWMLSCVAPVYVGDELAGVVGLDVTTKTLVDNIQALELPWSASAFLVDQDGMILAMPNRIEKLLGLTELKDHVYNSAIAHERLKPAEYNLFKNPDPAIVQSFRKVFDSGAPANEVVLGSHGLFLFQGLIPETGWHLFIIVQPQDLFHSVHQVERLSNRIGYGVIIVMLAFYAVFFLFLRRQAWFMAGTLSRPISALAEAVSRVGNQPAQRLQPSGVAELDSLTDSFNTMVGELDTRNQQLVESRVETKMKEKDAELAYAQGMFESASGYLHNVGNSITALDASLLDLAEIAKSAEQYPAVFARLRQGDDPAILDRFEKVVLERTVPRLRASTEAISHIRDSIRQTIHYQQQAFNATNSPMIPVRFDLSELVQRICDEYDRVSPPIQRDIEPGIMVTNHRNPMYQGLVNLVKNAREATATSGVVSVRLERSEQGAVVTIRDTGTGIAPEHLSKVLRAGFTTKAGGHGLGMHSFSVFLAAHRGRLQIHSDGPGCGTTITVEVHHV